MNEADVRNALLRLFLTDQREGRIRPLEEYVARFPDHGDAVRSELARLRGDEETLAGPGPAPERVPPAAIGPYRLLRELGRGGQGVVHLAEDTRLGRRVALKLLTGLGSFAAEGLQRFRREAEVASRLDHPNICTVYETGAVDGVPYIAMRHVEGRSLASLIAEARAARDPATGSGPSTWAESQRAVGLMEKTARAVHAAHVAGIIHRDLKPGNILVTPEGEPVILDFGLARDSRDAHESLTRTGDILGTPAYLSPEQLAGSDVRIDQRTDVWSLGVTLYEAVCHRRPFVSPTQQGLCQAILDRDPPRPRDLDPRIPRDLEAVLDLALEKDRDRRYRSALDFAEDLRRVAAREPVAARPAGPLLRARRWAQRNPLAAALAAGVFLALAAGAAVSLALLVQRGRALARYRQMSDVQVVQDLVRRDDRDLWPAWPERTAAMDAWLAEADEVLDRTVTHQEAITEIEAAAGASPPRAEDAWRLKVLKDLAAGLADLDLRRAKVRERRACAAVARTRSIDEHRAAWDACIADVAATPAYGGLVLTPQTDLVPLWKNPDSGLWEFRHLPTGTPPRLDAEEGLVRPGTGTCLVFVLLPAATLDVGCQSEDASRPNYDPQNWDRSATVARVELEPFLLSKFEMSQGQWVAAAGANPSFYAAGSLRNAGSEGLRHPVEQVSWTAAAELFRRLGFCLPTEAQWEYACRAGTKTPFSTGADPASLAGAANIADAGSAARFWPEWQFEPGFNDGHAFSAPVGMLLPNAFGFHDMHGNVAEWCRDTWGPSSEPPRARDGLREGTVSGSRAHRGGSFHVTALYARSADRSFASADFTGQTIGVRPARTLETDRPKR